MGLCSPRVRVCFLSECSQARSMKTPLSFLGTVTQCVFARRKVWVRAAIGSHCSPSPRDLPVSTASVFSVAATQVTHRTFLAAPSKAVYIQADTRGLSVQPEGTGAEQTAQCSAACGCVGINHSGLCSSEKSRVYLPVHLPIWQGKHTHTHVLK